MWKAGSSGVRALGHMWSGKLEIEVPALLLAQLTDIQKKAARAKGGDDATKAHWQSLSRQIEQALK